MKTLKEYMKESQDVLNSMKPFSKMKSYDEITVKIIVKDCNTEFVTHPWKAVGGFSFLDWSLCDVYVKRKDEKLVSIIDLEFVSIEILDNGLVVEVKG